MRNALAVLNGWDGHRHALAAWLVFVCISLEALCYAALPFNGVSGLQIQENGKQANLTFQGDMPVRYRLEVVSPEQVRLTLYQVKLSDDLLSGYNSILLPPSQLIRQATWKRCPDGVEILLTGPALGKHPPRIQDGIQEIAKETQAPSTGKPVVVFPVQTATRQSKPERVNIEAAEPEIKMVQAPEPKESATQVAKSGPRIVDIQAAEAEKPKEQEAFMPSLPEVIESRESAREAPEPRQFAAKPVQAYPIQAITYDEQGNPVQLVAKNKPSPTFSIGQPQAVYSALFQEEPASEVETLLAGAITAYERQQLADAQRHLEKALQLEPKNEEALALMAEVHMSRHNYAQACNAYQKAVNLRPGQYETRYAQALIRSGKRHEAIRVLESALLQDPQNVPVIHLLGTLNLEQGKPKIAVIYLEQAASLTSSPDILYNLGLSYEFAGNPTKARESYQKALTLSPGNSEITAALQRIRN